MTDRSETPRPPSGLTPTVSLRQQSSPLQSLAPARSGLSLVVSDPHAERIVVPVPTGEIQAYYTTKRDLRVLWQRPPRLALLICKRGDMDLIPRLARIAKFLQGRNLRVAVEESLVSQIEGAELLTQELRSAVDFLVVLGGDGTILHANTLFTQAVPPLLAFAGGSLGFLTPHDDAHHGEALAQLIDGGMPITLRMRLHARIVLDAAESNGASSAAAAVTPAAARAALSQAASSTSSQAGAHDAGSTLGKRVRSSLDDTEAVLHSTLTPLAGVPRPDGRASHGGTVVAEHHVVNEVVIDRGPSPYLTSLECYCNGEYFTTCMADGVIVATPTGSTAYSLAAGGSMVHPTIPAILLTPICPHSLSFRPVVLPDSVELRITLGAHARGTAWVSFDGRDRHELPPGHSVIITMSPWPLACFQTYGQTGWLRELADRLGWNLREARRCVPPPPAAGH